jgi:hypothetical protein
MVDIPRIKFFAQRRYRANWTFLDGHYLSLGISGWALPIAWHNVNLDQTRVFRRPFPARLAVFFLAVITGSGYVDILTILLIISH